MGQSKAVVIGNRRFPSMSAARADMRRILHTTSNEVPLEGADAQFVNDLFMLHPNNELKTAGRVIRHYTASSSRHGSRCFYVLLDEGKLEDFSFEKCLRNAIV